ncbi:MAG: flagellar hook-basal body complex protein FliE [bacterium]|jgi:flagellar hook-basal body complex protein FliE
MLEMIQSIQSTGMISGSGVSAKSAAKNFSSSFEKMFDEVNQSQLNADKKMEDLATGKTKDIHGTMIAMEKADVSMKLLMSVRSKLVSSYEEIMRMQV